jgi:hypothetical protein
MTKLIVSGTIKNQKVVWNIIYGKEAGELNLRQIRGLKRHNIWGTC